MLRRQKASAFPVSPVCAASNSPTCKRALRGKQTVPVGYYRTMVFTANGRKQTAPSNRLRRSQGAAARSQLYNITRQAKRFCPALWRISLFKFNAEPIAFAGASLCASRPSPYRCHGWKIPCRMRKRIQILVVQRQNNASAHPFGKRYSAHAASPQVPLPVSPSAPVAAKPGVPAIALIVFPLRDA